MSSYVIVDLELCRVPKGFRRDTYKANNEWIQIGAVILDDSLEITDTFMAFVSPEFGMIDSCIESLTGITNAYVENAPRLKQVLKAFVDWLLEEAILVS